MRVRALHATVLRRIEMFAAHGGKLPALPVGDALEDATVLIAGRGPLYPALSVAMGERVNMVGGLASRPPPSISTARDIDGIVVGDGFSPRMVEAFLTAARARHPLPRHPGGGDRRQPPPDFADGLPNIDHVDGDPARLVARMVPLVRMHAFEARLKRMLKSLDADGMFDPAAPACSPAMRSGAIWPRPSPTPSDRSQALSIARFSFEGALDERASLDGARLVTRLIRNIDFAIREDDGAILIAFTQTDLRSAHVVARRIAGGSRTCCVRPHRRNRHRQCHAGDAESRRHARHA